VPLIAAERAALPRAGKAAGGRVAGVARVAAVLAIEVWLSGVLMWAPAEEAGIATATQRSVEATALGLAKMLAPHA
jgi:hypothetical protein